MLNELILPNLKPVLFDDPLRTLEALDIDVQRVIQRAVFGIENTFVWDPFDLNLPKECYKPHLSQLDAINRMIVDEIREVPEDQYLIRVHANVQGDFNFYMSKSDSHLMVTDRRLRVANYNFSDQWLIGEVSLKLDVAVDLLVAQTHLTDPTAQVVYFLASDDSGSERPAPARFAKFPPISFAGSPLLPDSAPGLRQCDI